MCVCLYMRAFCMCMHVGIKNTFKGIKSVIIHHYSWCMWTRQPNFLLFDLQEYCLSVACGDIVLQPNNCFRSIRCCPWVILFLQFWQCHYLWWYVLHVLVIPFVFLFAKGLLYAIFFSCSLLHFFNSLLYW